MEGYTKEIINENFSISRNVSHNWRMKSFHFHDAFEIYLAMCDNIKYFIGDRIYDVNKGDLFVFNSMDLHKSVVAPGVEYERYIITFSPDYVSNFCEDDNSILDCFINRTEGFCHKVSLTADQLNSLLSLFKKAEFYSSGNNYGEKVYKKITLIEILLLVNSFYGAVKKTPNTNNEKYARVQSIIYYIDQHINEDLSLKRLSDEFFISKYHLGCIFKEATGFSPIDYIINRRILKSRELLKQEMSVSQVCEKVGFNNYCHFIRTFKKLVGVSPKQYAKKTVN